LSPTPQNTTIFGDNVLKRQLNKNGVIWVGLNPTLLLTLQKKEI
jgi:hypothetical protein